MKEEIINYLSKMHDAQTLIQINDALNLHSAIELKDLQKALDALIEENKVYKTKKEKYLLLENCEYLKCGKLSINKAGNGFLLLDGDDLYIDYKNLNDAVNGDEVIAELIKSKGKTEGRVIKILKRNTKNIIGEYSIRKNKPILILDDEKCKLLIDLDPNTTKDCVLGTKVLVNLEKELAPNHYIGKVVKIIGHKDDPGVDIKTIAYKYGIFEEFSKESEKQTEELPIMVE